ncbi:hypothetical protein [Accumulibacter sp.]|uniref:hypothetical protein n=1 Tax=Accumulibacter sp. TaxID=2053492 RepID=UPI0025CC9391|nr:hypothetical protein [Accumulibacter sp.]MCP5229261.1 hypothetical protein [Accumulibacter sp.]
MDNEPAGNGSENPHFAQLPAALSAPLSTRRRLLRLGIGSAALSSLSFFGVSALAGSTGGRPRSATLVIRREDGGVVGS